MANRSGMRRIALLVAFVVLLPAYFTGMLLMDVVSRSETPEYRVWRQAYVVDRPMYEAIARHPPPRYRHLATWKLRAGGAGFAVLVLLLLWMGLRTMLRQQAEDDAPPDQGR